MKGAGRSAIGKYGFHGGWRRFFVRALPSPRGGLRTKKGVRRRQRERGERAREGEDEKTGVARYKVHGEKVVSKLGGPGGREGLVSFSRV